MIKCLNFFVSFVHCANVPAEHRPAVWPTIWLPTKKQTSCAPPMESLVSTHNTKLTYSTSIP